MNMNKLIEMANAGVNISIYGGPYWGDRWHVAAKKEDDGIKLEVEAKHRDLQTAVDDCYEKWTSVTSRGARHLGLNQIDYVPPTPINLDDEIPF
jgi:hypothetical protein